MNVAFFLTPKKEVVWIPKRATMRQALERMEFHHYAAVPVLDEQGHYAGIVTEGDLLWMLKHNTRMSFEDTEHVPLADVPRVGRQVKPVRIDAEMEQLYALAAEQNFVPVVDDQEVFIGIVRRSTIIEYTVARLRKERTREEAASEDREEWVCVLDFEGRIAGVEGGAPSTWIGRPLEECPGIREEVRDAGRKLLHEWSQASTRNPVQRRRVRARAPGDPDFTLLAIEAIVLHPAPAELDQIVREALAPMMRQAEEQGTAVRIESAPEVPICIVDETKIAWAITAIVGNALRHVRRGWGSTPGGNLVVRLGHGERRSFVSLAVEDDGPGIPSSVRSYLFEPNPETGRTTGLALGLVHEIVAAHGGGMVVKSPADGDERGTTITLWLPTHAQPKPA